MIFHFKSIQSTVSSNYKSLRVRRNERTGKFEDFNIVRSYLYLTNIAKYLHSRIKLCLNKQHSYNKFDMFINQITLSRANEAKARNSRTTIQISRLGTSR